VHSGHQVTVITTVPHYPSGRVAESFRGKFIWHSIEDGVEVIRIGVPSVDRSKLLLRLIQFFCYQLGAVWSILLNPKYDVVLAGSSSLSVCLPFAASTIILRKPIVYSVQDLYPNVGITLGIFRSKLVIKVVSSLEKFILRNAKIIQIISDSFRPGLHDLGVPDDKIELVYNWVDTQFINPLPRLNEFSNEYCLNEKFVVLYAGNMGPSQGLETLLAAADVLRDERDIVFVIIGDGIRRKFLIDDAKKRSLSNVLFIPFQSRERFPLALASANIALVPLRRGIEQGSLPSKLFTALASGRPVIVGVEEESEIWKLVKKADAGLQVPPEDPDALSSAIQILKNNKSLREQMGRNARIWAEQNHSPMVARVKFERLFSAAIQKAQ
jgi:colanic acid biosynthesis glycosyl transferase WcaI